ncbi:hypothetical protein KL918_000394 [Ogataea parapolymorpha]|uniref:arginyltransferase n=1 Tax=Ogataea parapolymorpha (strain ATCC 26012 / BCRC 20466 / JCM 22074 / NRRL Y-7560 / DL-1) TaxID=871575 RepID=W1Q8U1_OGAPD|nr:arginine-tRNA-protein transferase [Ogataea parapolymorpha DL-1]ESW96441.1 arginine-tRNA-protein transferase [Ogataea parapolymorpha DL-1]KAG7870190.1 hypothetical protein KL918_000394 [Ogataea parapolymorpha]KAG7875139.1 hypothetical protein KL916_000751 [Ogataea parapolymorpha]
MDLVIGEPLYIVGGDCGYCHGKKDGSRKSYSLQSYEEAYDAGTRPFDEYPNSSTICCHVYSCTPEIYELMMNRGFRRSGSFLYRPDLLRNCCRLYTIRSNIKLLKVNKEHRHNVNRFVRFITGKESTNKNKPFDLKTALLGAETRTTSFKTVIGPAIFSPEKYALYKKYQTTIHNDDPNEVSEKGFKRFLCQSFFPELYSDFRSSEYWSKLNSWREFEVTDIEGEQVEGPVHECYYIDDKLVAIGVLDILPTSVSSVYFIWDPDYAHLGLGTLSALRELVLTEQLGKEYYYLGYYADDCHKMKYKAKFGGEILDLTTLTFYSLDELKKVTDCSELIALSEAESTSTEPAIPSTIKSSPISHMINVAENIYGVQGGSFSASRNAAQEISGILGLSEFGDQSDDELWRRAEGSTIHALPLVSPGLIPLWQIMDWVATGAMRDKFSYCLVLDHTNSQHGQLFDFSNKTSADFRKSFIDLLRMFGAKLFENAKIVLLM